jgi:hypothetical protein
MKIRYARKRLKHYLIFGILWLILGTIAILFNSDNIFNYGYLLMGVFYMGTFLFENNKHYLTLENGVIIQHFLTPKKINLHEITQIKHFGGQYILTSDTQKMKINIDLIDQKSLSHLKAELEKLEVEWR